ncbi:MAG: VCBS repeat-containing protein [Planctomycetota bacterium]
MSTPRAFPSPLALLLGLTAAPAAAQLPGVVDYTPDPPPTATWPVLQEVGDSLAGPGTDYSDVGSGRGHSLVDLVGPDPADPGNPNKVGPPDGILDLVQTNSNSAALPLGAGPTEWIVEPIGTSHSRCLVFRGGADGSWTDVTDLMSPLDPNGFNLAWPGGSPWGVIPADYDGDGDSDLWYACGGFNTSSINALQQNQGDGTFVNVSAAAGMGQSQDTFSGTWFDPDLDGDLDLYVGNGAVVSTHYYTGAPDPDPTDRLFENQGDGTFVDVAVAAGTPLKSNAFSVVAGDLTLNGYPDVVVGCFTNLNKVFYNNGDMTFAFMVPAGTPGFSYSLDDMTEKFDGSFDFPASSISLTEEMIIPFRGKRTMPMHLVDINNDGWLDVVNFCWSIQVYDEEAFSAVGAMFSPAERGYAYLNRGDQDRNGVGDGLFREVAGEIGLAHVGGAMGSVASDLNGDGFVDFYVGGGGPELDKDMEEDYVYINEPTSWPADFQQNPAQPLGKCFWEVGALVGVYANIEMAHGLSANTRAGRADVVVGNGGPAIKDKGQKNLYWSNTGNADGLPYNAVELALEPKTSPPGARGARIQLIRDAGGGAAQVQTQERNASYAFTCQNTGPNYFAYGQDELLFAGVRWPTGVSEGRLLWALDPTPSELSFEEGTVSLALDADYPGGGGLTLTLTAEETGPSPELVELLFAVFTPQPGGGFLPTLIATVATGALLEPSQPLTLGATIDPAPDGLYAVAMVDTLSGELVNVAAVWHEQALATPTPADATAPAPGFPDAGTAAASRSELVRERVLARAASLSISTARLPLAFEAVDLDGTGSRELPTGEVLRWAGGRIELTLNGARAAVVALDGANATLTTGTSASCCDATEAPGELGSLIRITGVEALAVDGAELLP